MIVDETNIHEFLNEDGTRLNCSCQCVKSLVIPDTFFWLEKIFCYGNQLTSLTIPDTCTKLEKISCYNNKLTSLKIPYACTKLKKMICDEIEFILVLCCNEFKLWIKNIDKYSYYKEQTKMYLSELSFFRNTRLFM